MGRQGKPAIYRAFRGGSWCFDFLDRDNLGAGEKWSIYCFNHKTTRSEDLTRFLTNRPKALEHAGRWYPISIW